MFIYKLCLYVIHIGGTQMVATKVKLGKKLKCLRCNHKWIPRTTEVFTCPNCRSAYWNVKKRSED